MQQEHADSMTVADAGSVDLVVTYPEEPLDAALTKMLQRDIGRLPVVDQTDPTQVVGYLGRAAILSARLRLHQEENVRQRG
jgi:CBS domain-containing protein